MSTSTFPVISFTSSAATLSSIYSVGNLSTSSWSYNAYSAAAVLSSRYSVGNLSTSSGSYNAASEAAEEASYSSRIASEAAIDASLISKFPFSYVIPYDQPQDCNIFGPLCQTGSITVQVNLTTTMTPTVLPCSFYLTAQAIYLAPPMSSSDDETPFDRDPLQNIFPQSWDSHFGRSPECRSFAALNGSRTISNCGTSYSVYPINDAITSQIPPGVFKFRDAADENGICCGNCSLDTSEVRLYYFVDNPTTAYSLNETSNITSIPLPGTLQKRMHSLVGNLGIAVVSGQTFTSPSVYLQLVGTAAVSDECSAVISPALTNPIITLAPGALYTWTPPTTSLEDYHNFSIGASFDNFDNNGLGSAKGESAPLDVRDLASPTWGLGRSTLADGTVVTTIGPPFLPVIVPPTQLFTLAPAWETLCPGFLTDDPFQAGAFLLYDPPTVLAAQSMLVPAQSITPKPTPPNAHAGPTTVPDPQATLPSDPAKPASGPVDSGASPTKGADPNGGGRIATSSPVPPEPPSDPNSSPDAPQAQSANPQVPVQSLGGGAANGTPNPAPPAPPNDSQSPGASQAQQIPPQAPVQSPAQQGVSPPSQAQNIGDIIYSAFGKSGNEPVVDSGNVNTITVPSVGVQEVNIGGSTLSVDPSGLRVDGTAYPAGGPPLTLASSVFTPVAQPNSNDSPNDPPPDPLTIAGQVVTPNPSSIVVAGSTILPGGPPITLSKIPLALASSGALIYGSSTLYTPPTPAPLPSPDPLTIAGQLVTPNPSNILVAGSTLLPGGSPVILSNTPLSLASSGVLIYGSSILYTPPTPGPLPSPNPTTIAGQKVNPNPSNIVVAGSTLVPGGPPITLSNTPLSLGPSGVLIYGSSTLHIPPTPAPPTSDLLTIAGQLITAYPSSILISGSTLLPGGPSITLSNTPLSLGSSGVLIYGSSTIHIPLTPGPLPTSLTVAGQIVTPNPTDVAVAGSTLLVGGPPITLSNTPLSLASSGVLIYGSSTINIPLPPQSTFTIGSQTFTVNRNGFMVNSAYVAPGGSAQTIDGTVISLDQSGHLAIGSTTINLPASASAVDPPISQPVVVAGQTITPNASAFAIDGTTLSAGGPAITVGGTVVSLESSGTLVVGSSTIVLPSALQTPLPYTSLFKVDGLTVQELGQPSFSGAVVVDGVTLTPGEAGTTIAGSPVSLEAGGRTLDVGSQKIGMPTATGAVNSTGGIVSFEGGQGRAKEASIILVYGALATWMLLV